MKSKQTFKDLDPDLQDIAVQIVEGLDYSYATAMKEYDPDPYAYIRDKFIVPMGNLSDSDKQKLQSSFEQLFKLDAENISQSNQAEIENLITTIATLLEKDPLEIRVALGFDIEDVQNRYNEALKEAKRQLGGFKHDDRGFETNNSVGDKLDDFWNENVVTEEDWLLWQKVTAGIDDATKAMNAYTEAKKNANSVSIDENPVSTSISENISDLKNLNNELDKLGSAIANIDENGKYELSDLDSIADYFLGLEDIPYNIEAVNDSLKVLGSEDSTLEEQANAINTLADQYLKTSGILDDLTAENAELIKLQLQRMGITNKYIYHWSHDNIILIYNTFNFFCSI